MTTQTLEPEVIFPEGSDERWEDEMPLKGFLNDVLVRLDVGRQYSVNFIDPVRLAQDLEVETSEGRLYFTEPNLIVLPEVTSRAIVDSIRSRWRDGFFDSIWSNPALKAPGDRALGTNGPA